MRRGIPVVLLLLSCGLRVVLCGLPVVFLWSFRWSYCGSRVVLLWYYNSPRVVFVRSYCGRIVVCCGCDCGGCRGLVVLVWHCLVLVWYYL